MGFRAKGAKDAKPEICDEIDRPRSSPARRGPGLGWNPFPFLPWLPWRETFQPRI
jgi:hypothetical protein